MTKHCFLGLDHYMTKPIADRFCVTVVVAHHDDHGTFTYYVPLGDNDEHIAVINRIILGPLWVNGWTFMVKPMDS